MAWEYCDIDVELHSDGLFSRTWRVQALIIGPKGRTKGLHETFKTERITEEFMKYVPGSYQQIGQQALNKLIGKLVNQGWEPLPKSGDWFGYRFRRAV